MVIPAIGQAPELGFMGRDSRTRGDPPQHVGRRPGHPVHHPARCLCRGRRRQRAGNRIEAIAAGKRAADSIHRYCRARILAAPSLACPVVP